MFNILTSFKEFQFDEDVIISITSTSKTPVENSNFFFIFIVKITCIIMLLDLL